MGHMPGEEIKGHDNDPRGTQNPPRRNAEIVDADGLRGRDANRSRIIELNKGVTTWFGRHQRRAAHRSRIRSGSRFAGKSPCRAARHPSSL